jgi:hypothetical protein
MDLTFIYQSEIDLTDILLLKTYISTLKSIKFNVL